MKIYTKKGDKGQTTLFSGEKADKDDQRIEANGTLDEVNSTIGLLRVKSGQDHNWQEGLHQIQVEVMQLMSFIASPGKEINIDPINKGIKKIEEWIDEICAKTDKMNALILPGGNEISALCHIIRTQVRRAERKVFKLHKTQPVEEACLSYLNRLSDLFFMLAQLEMQESDIPVEKFKYPGPDKEKNE